MKGNLSSSYPWDRTILVEAWDMPEWVLDRKRIGETTMNVIILRTYLEFIAILEDIQSSEFLVL